MKLNCDLGEGFAEADIAIMPFIDQANIACTGHAGDTASMVNTIELALQHNVSIGAHPSYPDKENFGRLSLKLSLDQLYDTLKSQIDQLIYLCAKHNAHVAYIKPHGALYNDLVQQPALFKSVIEFIHTYYPSVALMIQSTSQNDAMQNIANTKNVKLIFEAFADRRYNQAGFLLPRNQPESVLEHPQEIYNQAKNIIQNKQVTTNTNKPLGIFAHTLCVHGDNPAALDAVQRIRQLL